MNRFATSILFCPVTDESGTYWINISNVCYYHESEEATGGTDIHMFNGEVVNVSMELKNFTNMLKGESK